MVDQAAGAGSALGVPQGLPALLLRRSEAFVIPLAALLVGFMVFSLFLLALGKSPVQFYQIVYQAGFGTAFSWQNTLSRVSPLLFAALCVALPARRVAVPVEQELGLDRPELPVDGGRQQQRLARAGDSRLQQDKLDPPPEFPHPTCYTASEAHA